MFALGLQKTGQTVALLLWSADGKKRVQIVIVTTRRSPCFGEVPNHRTNLRLHPMFLKIPPQKGDDLPMRFGQLQIFRTGLCPCKVFRPIAQVFQIASESVATA